MLPLRTEAGETRPVVVELFTSQGCSTSPPADALLTELADQPGVLALSFHVDYWDYIGWEDPFATAEYTERQRDYVAKLGLRYVRSEEHTSELQSLMRISYAVFCLKKKKRETK